MALDFFFVNLSNITFHENASSRSGITACVKVRQSDFNKLSAGMLVPEL
jgi:hypothetical protein